MLSERNPHAQTLRLTPQLLVAAYSQGLFPMARSRNDPRVEWFSPDPRAILPLEDFRCPRSLRQLLRRANFELRIDTSFEAVVRACAAPRPGHPETWINGSIQRAFVELHRAGLAHSVEAWRDGVLVGGLYGVALGSAFFGESMFSRPSMGGSNASKACLVQLVERLKSNAFTLLDVQMNSGHMAQFGVIEIPRDHYLILLEKAICVDSCWPGAIL